MRVRRAVGWFAEECEPEERHACVSAHGERGVESCGSFIADIAGRVKAGPRGLLDRTQSRSHFVGCVRGDNLDWFREAETFGLARLGGEIKDEEYIVGRTLHDCSCANATRLER